MPDRHPVALSLNVSYIGSIGDVFYQEIEIILI